MGQFNYLDLLIQQTRIKRVCQYVPPRAHLLDLGCGYHPNCLSALAGKISSGLGFDRQIPSQSPAPNISLCQGEIEQPLPFTNGQFDCLLLLAVLEHLNQPAKVLAECFRILQPAGRLIITIPTPAAKPILNSLAFLGLINRAEVKDHKHYFNQTELAALITNTGFKILVNRKYNLGFNLLLVAEKPKS